MRRLSSHNPALLLGVDLPFVVGTAFSLKNAAAISLQMLMIHLCTMLAARTLTLRLPTRFRPIANVCASTVMMLISRELVRALFPGIVNSVGIYLYLMAVNGLTLAQANTKLGRQRLGQVAVRSLFDILFFSLMMFAVSFAREIFGNGTLWGIALPIPIKLSGIQLPFFGFIFTGCLLAALRKSGRGLAVWRMRSAALQDAPYIELTSPSGPVRPEADLPIANADND